jgi:hypothetical protein
LFFTCRYWSYPFQPKLFQLQPTWLIKIQFGSRKGRKGRIKQVSLKPNQLGNASQLLLYDCARLRQENI